MSTKKMRQALQALKTAAGLPAGPLAVLAAEALAEVEAIEKAAQALDGIRAAWHGEAYFASGQELADRDAAADVLERIAKESTT